MSQPTRTTITYDAEGKVAGYALDIGVLVPYFSASSTRSYNGVLTHFGG